MTVLLLHSVFGLRPAVRAAADRIRGDPKPGGLPVQLHVADPDRFEPAGWLEEWSDGMRRCGARAEIFRYPGAGHVFTDPGLTDHDETAAEAAWTRAPAFVQGL